MLAGPARAEAVAALANMTISALGGARERPAQDHRQPPGADGGRLPAPVLDGTGPPAHRVDSEPVRPGGQGRRDGLGTRRHRGDRHRPGDLRQVGSCPGRVHRAGHQGLHRGGRGDLRDRDHPAGPVQRRGGAAGGVRRDHRYPADRLRRGLRSRRRERPRAAGLQGHHGRDGAPRDGPAAAGEQARRSRARRAAHPAARRVCPRRRRGHRHRRRRGGPGRDPGRVRRVRRLRVGLRSRQRVQGKAVPTAGLRRRVGRPAALGQAHPRPRPWRAEESVLRGSLRARPLHIPAHRRARRHRAHGAAGTAPGRMAGTDQRPPRGIHHLGGVPGQRGKAGRQPHERRRPAAPRGQRPLPGNRLLRIVRQADARQLPLRRPARLRVLLPRRPADHALLPVSGRCHRR